MGKTHNPQKTIMLTLVSLLVLISAIATASAYQISVKPANIEVDDLLRGGYYEKSVFISSSTEEETEVKYWLDAPEIEDWITFEPDADKLYISGNNPQELTMIIEPPEDTPNGRYNGTLRFSLKPPETDTGETGFSLQPGVAADIELQVTGEQITRCKVTDMNVPTIEEGENLSISGTFYNNGNVQIEPDLSYTVTAMEGEEKLSDTHNQDPIKPTTQGSFTISEDNELDHGQYFISLNSEQCDYSKRMTFDILEPGKKTKELKFGDIRPEEVWNRVGDNIEVRMKAENTGETIIREARFKGEITLDERSIEKAETETLRLDPGEETTFTYTFNPEQPGRYKMGGHIYYDDKKSFEKNAIINVKPRKEEPTKASFLSPDPLNLTIGLLVVVIMVLGGLIIRRKRR